MLNLAMKNINYQEVNDDILEIKYKGIDEDLLVDLINEPPHYKSKGGIEPIEVIESFELGFHLGNVVKYILRADKKGNKKQDLEKAQWYLNRELQKLD